MDIWLAKCRLLRPDPNEPLDIFRDQIKLQVHSVSGLQLMQIRHVPGMRNDPVHKPIRMQLRDRQTNAAHRDRSFKHHVLRKRLRQLDLKPVILSYGFDSKEFRSGIDVPLNNMPIEPARYPHWSFEVDQVSGVQLTKITSANGFSEQIEPEQARALCDHSQADAVIGNAVTNLQLRSERCLHLEPVSPRARLNHPLQLADSFDNSSEHFPRL